MSQAAEASVKDAPPEVKGAALTLLEVLAQLIPEGETTTAAIRIEDLATRIRQSRRTVYRCLERLEQLEVIKVWDGGRGKIARYELRLVTGRRPSTNADLALLGQTPRRASTVHPTPLFDLPSGERTVENVGQNVTRWILNVGQFVTRWWVALLNVGQNVTRWSATSAKSSAIDAPHLDLDLSSRSVEVDHARARGAPEFLTWWLATFSQHPKFRTDSAVDRLRDGPLIRELLESRTFEALQSLALLCWEIQSDGVHDSNRDWIATSNHSITVFHRKIQFLEEERDRLRAPPVVARGVDPTRAGAADDKWQESLTRSRRKGASG